MKIIVVDSKAKDKEVKEVETDHLVASSANKRLTQGLIVSLLIIKGIITQYWLEIRRESKEKQMVY